VALQEGILTNHRAIYSPDKETSFRVYEQVVGDFLGKASPLAAAYIRAGEYNNARPADLFVWGTLVGLPNDVVKKFWSKCDSPIVAALLASHLCQGMASKISWGRAEVLERAARLEAWAVGVLDAIPKQHQALRILGFQHGELWGHSSDTILDLAMRTGMKSFASHRYCTALMDRMWRGEHIPATPTLPHDFSYLALFCKALLPVHLLLEHRDGFLKGHHEDGDEGRGGGRYAKIRKEEVMDALAMTMRYSVFQHTELSKKLRRAADGAAAAAGAEAPLVVKGSRPTPADLKAYYVESTANVNELPPPDEDDAHHRRDRSQLEQAAEAVAGFYRVPAVKFVLRFASHLLLLLLFGTVLTSSPNASQVVEMAPLLPKIRWQEVIFTLWVFGIGADEWHQSAIKQARGVSDVLSSPFEGLIDIGQRFLVIGLLFRWAVLIAPTPFTARVCYIIYQEVISLDVILVSLELLSFLSVMRHFGVLVIMITGMVQDMVSFFQLFALIIVAFSLSFIGLSSTADVEETALKEWETPGDIRHNFAETPLGAALGYYGIGGEPGSGIAAASPGRQLMSRGLGGAAVGVATAFGEASRRMLRQKGVDAPLEEDDGAAYYSSPAAEEGAAAEPEEGGGEAETCDDRRVHDAGVGGLRRLRQGVHGGGSTVGVVADVDLRARLQRRARQPSRRHVLRHVRARQGELGGRVQLPAHAARLRLCARAPPDAAALLAAGAAPRLDACQAGELRARRQGGGALDRAGLPPPPALVGGAARGPCAPRRRLVGAAAHGAVPEARGRGEGRDARLPGQGDPQGPRDARGRAQGGPRLPDAQVQGGAGQGVGARRAPQAG